MGDHLENFPVLHSLRSQAGIVDINHGFHLYYSVDFKGFLQALRSSSLLKIDCHYLEPQIYQWPFSLLSRVTLFKLSLSINVIVNFRIFSFHAEFFSQSSGLGFLEVCAFVVSNSKLTVWSGPPSVRQADVSTR